MESELQFSHRRDGNVGDQRAVAKDIDLTKKTSSAAPLHPMVPRFPGIVTNSGWTIHDNAHPSADASDRTIPMCRAHDIR